MSHVRWVMFHFSHTCFLYSGYKVHYMAMGQKTAQEWGHHHPIKNRSIWINDIPWIYLDLFGSIGIGATIPRYFRLAFTLPVLPAIFRIEISGTPRTTPLGRSGHCGEVLWQVDLGFPAPAPRGSGRFSAPQSAERPSPQIHGAFGGGLSGRCSS